MSQTTLVECARVEEFPVPTVTPALIAKRIAQASVFSSELDPTFGLDNFQNERILKITDTLRLKGFTSKQNVDNYLNVPFGRISARFMPAQMVRLDEMQGTLNARLYGPRCPQKATPSRWDVEHDWELLGCTQRMSELDCLAANVYSPPAGTPGAPFPVIAHIHGGALSIGDAGPEKGTSHASVCPMNWLSQHVADANHLIKRAIELGKPFVFVSLAYRVGAFGFLTSKEIIQEQHTTGIQNPVLMQGFEDQRIGLEWVQRYVHHFGGDPSEVTLAGESAGALSIWWQMKGRSKGLFKRCFIRSFGPPTIGTMESHQQAFDKIIGKLGINSDAPAYVKVAAMRSMSAQQLLDIWDGKPPQPIFDPAWSVEPDSPSEGPESLDYWTNTPDWLEEVVIGFTRDETSLFGCNIWPKYGWSDVHEALAQCYSPSVCSRIKGSKAYKACTTPYEAMYAITSEAAFCGPSVEAAERMAQRNKVPVSVYIVEGTECHPGPLRGTAPHGADLTYYTYQPGHRIYPEMAATSDHFSKSLASFVHGEGAWEPLQSSGKYMAFNGTKTCLKHIHEDRQDREMMWDSEIHKREFYAGGFKIIGQMFSKGNLNAI